MNSPALLGILALLGLMIAGIVLMVVKMGPRALWIIIPVVIVLLVLPGLAWVRSADMPSRSHEMIVPAMVEEREERPSAVSARDYIEQRTSNWVPSPDVLDDDVSGTFLADVYPSAEQAARALAAHLAKRADYALMPDVVVVGKAEEAIVNSAAAGLGSELTHGSKVTVVAKASPLGQDDDNRAVCVVTATGTKAGTVQVVLDVPGGPSSGTLSESARFDDTPWAANFAQYAAQASGPVVRAASPAAATYEQARQKAFEDAARQLGPYARSAMAPMAVNQTPDDGRVDSQLVREVILDDLRAGRLVREGFPQQFDRPYGRLWREQLLIDASPGEMRRVAAAVLSRYNQRLAAGQAVKETARQAWLNTIVSLGGIAVLIFAVYLVLNAATKGYYSTVLRVLAIGSIVAGAAVVLMMA